MKQKRNTLLKVCVCVSIDIETLGTFGTGYGIIWYGMVCYGMLCVCVSIDSETLGNFSMVWYGMVWYVCVSIDSENYHETEVKHACEGMCLCFH